MVLTAEDLKREFKKLARSEQVGLLFDLWDEVGPTDEVFELTEAQREELERRWQRYNADPGSALSWEEVQARLTQRFG